MASSATIAPYLHLFEARLTNIDNRKGVFEISTQAQDTPLNVSIPLSKNGPRDNNQMDKFIDRNYLSVQDDIPVLPNTVYYNPLLHEVWDSPRNGNKLAPTNECPDALKWLEKAKKKNPNLKVWRRQPI